MPEDIDYTKGLDLKPGYNTGDPPIDFTPVFGTAGFEQFLNRSRDILKDSGYTPQEIDELFRTSLPKNTPAYEEIDISRLHEVLAPHITEAEIRSLEETLKIQQSIKADGSELGPFDMSAIRQFLKVYADGFHREAGPEGIRALDRLAESRTWWRRLQRQLARAATDVIESPAFNLGLLTLDGAAWVQNKWLLQHVPKHRKAELEARMIPKIPLRSDPTKEFTSGISAASYNILQKLYGALEWNAGIPLVVYGKAYGKPGMTEIGQMTMRRGTERYKAAREDLPELVASLGEYIPPSEMMADSDEAIDAQYKEWLDAGNLGTAAFASRAFGNALVSVFYDPMYLASSFPVKIVKGIERLTPLGKRLAKAEKIAIHSHTLEDALESKAVADEFYDAAKKTMETTAEKIGGKVKVEDFQRVLSADRHRLNCQKMIEQYTDQIGSFQEPFFMKPARKAPGFLPDAEAVEKEYKYLSEVAKDLTDARHKSLSLPKRIDDINWAEVEEAAFQRRYIMGSDDGEDIGAALKHMVQTGGTGIDDVTLHPLSAEYQVTPQYQIPITKWDDATLKIDKIERGLLAEGKISNDESLIRMLVRQESIYRKNLGAARAAGDKGSIQFYEESIKNLQKMRGEVHLKDLPKALEEYKADAEKWLPGLIEGPLTSPGRFHRWMETTGDRLAYGLNPGGFWQNSPIVSRMLHPARKIGDMIQPHRDPQRILAKYSPETWIKVRDLDLMYNQNMRAYIEECNRIFIEAGIAKERTNFNPARHFSKLKINKIRDQKLMNLLDTDPVTDEFSKLWEEADPKLRIAHDKMRNIYDNFADELKLPKSKRISGYAPHLFDHTWIENNTRPPEFNGMRLSPKMFFGHLLERAGATGYKMSAVETADFYGRGAMKKLFKEPMLQEIMQAGDDMANATGKRWLQDYMWDWAADLKGKPSPIGRKFDRLFTDEIEDIRAGKIAWRPRLKEDRILAGLTGLMWAGALVGNPRYPLMQIGTGLITTASRFSMLRTAKGLFQMATPEGQALAKQIGVAQSFERIYESSAFRAITDKLSSLGITQTEYFIRGTTALAAIDLYLNKAGFATWDDAVKAGRHRAIMFEALRASEEVNHLFGPMGRSAYTTRTIIPFQSKSIATAATQFLSFIPKQTEEILAQFRNNPGRIVQHLMLAGWASRVAARELGVDITNYVGLGYLPKEFDEVTSPSMDLLISSVNWVNAAGRNDKADMDRYGEEFLNSLKLAVPLVTGWQTAARSAERLIDSEVTSARGERVRAIELEFERGKVPFGPERIPISTGMQSIRDVQFYEYQKARRQFTDKMTAETRRLLQDYGDAVSDGDVSAESDIRDRLISEYGVPLIGETSLQRAREARMISSIFRQLDYAPRRYKHIYLEMLKQYGIELKP